MKYIDKGLIFFISFVPYLIIIEAMGDANKVSISCYWCTHNYFISGPIDSIGAYKCPACLILSFECRLCHAPHAFKRLARLNEHMKQKFSQHTTPQLRSCKQCGMYFPTRLPQSTATPVFTVYCKCAKVYYQCGLCTTKITIRDRPRNMNSHLSKDHPDHNSAPPVNAIAFTNTEDMQLGPGSATNKSSDGSSANGAINHDSDMLFGCDSAFEDTNDDQSITAQNIAKVQGLVWADFQNTFRLNQNQMFFYQEYKSPFLTK